MKPPDPASATTRLAATSSACRLRDAGWTDAIISTHTLFGHKREIFLEHAGVQYRLRITQNNKLILTK